MYSWLTSTGTLSRSSSTRTFRSLDILILLYANRSSSHTSTDPCNHITVTLLFATNDHNGVAHIITAHVYGVSPPNPFLSPIPVPKDRARPTAHAYAASEGVAVLAPETKDRSTTFGFSTVPAAENNLRPFPLTTKRFAGHRGKRRTWLDGTKRSAPIAGPFASDVCELYLFGSYDEKAETWTVKSIHHRDDRREVPMADVKRVGELDYLCPAFVLDGNRTGEPSKRVVLSVFPNYQGRKNT